MLDNLKAMVDVFFVWYNFEYSQRWGEAMAKPCARCGGGGRITCDMCGGLGIFDRPPFDSLDPFSSGHVCHKCHGYGEVTCPACHARGGIDDDADDDD